MSFYIEKPLSNEIKNCLNTLKKIKKTKKKVAVGYMLVNHPIILKTQSLLRRKVIGDINFVRQSVVFIYLIGIHGKITESSIWLTRIKVVEYY